MQHNFEERKIPCLALHRKNNDRWILCWSPRPHWVVDRLPACHTCRSLTIKLLTNYPIKLELIFHMHTCTHTCRPWHNIGKNFLCTKAAGLGEISIQWKFRVHVYGNNVCVQQWKAEMTGMYMYIPSVLRSTNRCWNMSCEQCELWCWWKGPCCGWTLYKYVYGLSVNIENLETLVTIFIPIVRFNRDYQPTKLM